MEFEQEYPGSSFLASRAFLEIENVGARIGRAVAAVCRAQGLSHAAINALAVIEGNEEPIATGDLAARMHVTSGTMTSLIDTLERQGLVTRQADPDDRRRLLIDITPQANAVLDEVLPAIQQIAKALLATFPERQLKTLLATLDDVHRALDSLPDEYPPAVRHRPARLDR